jgi:hypothetical protein
MPAGLRRVLPAAAAVLFIALALPAGAFADKCNASACRVYHEQDVPNAGRKQQPPPPTGPNTSGAATHVPTKLSRVLSHAGKDKVPLKNLLTDAGLGDLRAGPAAAGSPSALGAAFDLGTGPLVLLAILLATAVGLAARGPVRGWLSRRSSL